jgi:ADP-heptose:LPS heptosyltransferase
VRLISLQKNEGVEQTKNLPVGMKIENLPDDFDSGENAFLDSVAVMRCVDLVITSDTALTHLAGSLGVKTWLPLRYLPDWRWLLDRDDSPWYPSMKIYRQVKIGDWSSVFNEIETELKNLVLTKIIT